MIVTKARSNLFETELAMASSAIAVLHELHDRSLVRGARDARPEALRCKLQRFALPAGHVVLNRRVDPSPARTSRDDDPIPTSVLQEREPPARLVATRLVARCLRVLGSPTLKVLRDAPP